MKQNSLVVRIALGIVVLSVAGYIGYRYVSSWWEEKQTRARDAEQRAHAIDEMVGRHKAIRDWEDNLDSWFTIDLEKAWVREDQRPVLLFGGLFDVQKRGDHYVGMLECAYDTGEGTTISVRHFLECDPQQAARLVRYSADTDYPTYEIVAQVSSVSRPVFKVSANAYAEDDEDDYGWIQIEDADMVVTRGKLIDFLPAE